MKQSYSQPSVEQISSDSSKPVDVFALPGILASSHDWVKPVVPTLEQYGTVHGLLYGNDGLFDPEAAIDLMVAEAKHTIEMGRRAVLVASSLGGDLAPFIAAKLKNEMQDDEPNLAMLVMDAPFGIDTLKPLPPFAYSAVQRLAERGYRPSKLTEKLGNATVMRLMTMPSSLPKAHETTTPTPEVMEYLAGRGDYDATEWYEVVRELAGAALSGNSFSMYATQNLWMVRIGDDGTLERAIQEGFTGRDGYIASTKLNVTVTQPLAMNRWLDLAPGATTKEVEGPHVALLQMQREWSEAIGGMMKDLAG